jgi:hypothetical protein
MNTKIRQKLVKKKKCIQEIDHQDIKTLGSSDHL